VNREETFRLKDDKVIKPLVGREKKPKRWARSKKVTGAAITDVQGEREEGKTILGAGRDVLVGVSCREKIRR